MKNVVKLTRNEILNIIKCIFMVSSWADSKYVALQ